MKKLVLLSFILFSLIGCGEKNDSSKTSNLESEVSTPKIDLHAAVYMKDHDAIKQHIKAGSDLNNPEPSRKSTPLITAAALGEAEAAKLLIEAGADLDIKNIDGSTALHTAIVFGHEKVAEVLIDGGADLNLGNNDGGTSLHTAAFFGKLNIVKAILDKGADKNIKDKYGKTALDIVETAFNDVEPIYNSIEEKLKPLGITFDYDHLKKVRPEIADILR